MESAVEQPLYRVTWRVTINKHGTSYIHIPKEFSSLAGLKEGDLLELSILRLMKKPHGERKQEK